MKNIEAVKSKLEKLGCPVLPGGNWSQSSLFEISSETGKLAPNGWPWADSNLHNEKACPLGVNSRIKSELAKAGLFCEWINAGVVGVFKS